jgi:hypothetical protein
MPHSISYGRVNILQWILYRLACTQRQYRYVITLIKLADFKCYSKMYVHKSREFLSEIYLNMEQCTGWFTREGQYFGKWQYRSLRGGNHLNMCLILNVYWDRYFWIYKYKKIIVYVIKKDEFLTVTSFLILI